ncbi:MAG: hypothetical protein KJ060_02590 [Candidatus Hydrogenedentes bacterium]|nr:hypothetical protein [Candidatus Hydrogenedentota bacterium]
MMRLRNAVPVALVTVLAWSGAFAQDDTPANTKPEPATVEHAPKPVPKEIAELPLVPEPVESPDENLVFRVHSSLQVPEPGQEIDPEVAIAEAQVREAEARLRQARIAAAQREIEKEQLKRIVELARKNAKEEQRRAEMGIGTQQGLMEAQERLARAEADMAKLDAASQIMDGRGGKADSPLFQGRLFEQPRFPAPRPTLGDDDSATEVEARLRAPVSIEFDQETLRNIAGFIGEYSEVNIVLDVAINAADEKVSIKLSNVPLADCLMALSDAYGDLCFVIRDYGVFATTTERAMTINAPTIPANVPLLVPIQEASGGGFAVGGFGFGGAGRSGGGGFGMSSGPGAAKGGFGGGGGVIAFPEASGSSQGRSLGELPESGVAPGSSPDGGQPADAGGQDNSPEE